MKASDKRKFPRVQIANEKGELQKIMGVTVRWADGASSDVLDMSYSGAALSRPPGLKAAAGDTVSLDFQIDQQARTQISAQVVRVGEHVVAIHFQAISAAARVALEDFLRERLLGLSLRLINPHYYDAKEDFTYWFHGPNETNIFLWMKKKALGRAMVELGGQVLVYENEQFSEGEMIGEGDDKAARMTSHQIKKMTPLMYAVLELIAHVQDGGELLDRLIHALQHQAK